MGTLTLSLLKSYTPFSSILFSHSPRAAFPRAAIFRKNNLPSFRAVSSSSQPVTAEKNCNNSENFRSKSSSPEIWLHNTMSKKKELFKPKIESKVGMYVCGVTAYDLSHIGHARVYVNFDLLYRYFKHLGFEIIARSTELGEDPISLSRRYCEEFCQDMVTLNCLPPTKEPKVSEHMPQIIDMIEKIVNNGYAYNVDGDVYFNVEKFPEYGKLSSRGLEDNRAGERVAVDTRKKNPADFALWKSTKPGEPFWESPWGPGRPGWHIECSAMSATYLGYSFDIHGGGIDLVFPHHENEIAQSCAACSKSDISVWMHNGFVNIDSVKMSKSLGNFFTIRQGKKQQFRIESLAALKKRIGDVLTVLGLMPSSYFEVLQQLKEKALKRANLTEEEILKKIEERDDARIQKEYAKSDAIRKDLAVAGIALMDSPNGTAWRPTIPLPLQEQL
ncbi:hypothetical protein TSUD_305680 [Trifolium subterraneum]|uniref:cysteine--tRNA ligase n=1 Tax=Trifolium subterraneum TaxID=3900 RepID=A0A2Z6MII4_TRISU|nr:hypothetical protein TSUD_305680 [Trifolium subterraneum]